MRVVHHKIHLPQSGKIVIRTVVSCEIVSAPFEPNELKEDVISAVQEAACKNSLKQDLRYYVAPSQTNAG